MTLVVLFFMILRQAATSISHVARLRWRQTAYAAILFVLATPLSAVENLKPPPSANNEKGASVAIVKGGAQRWRTDWTMERSTRDGRAVVRFTERGSGRYSPFEGDVKWTTESIWTADQVFRPLRIDRVVTDANGRQLLKESKSFDFAKSAVVIEQENKTGRAPSRRSIEIPPDTLTVDGIAGALRSLPFEQRRPFETHLLSNEPKLYDVNFEVRGRERVRTLAGEFECYKVELVPGLGVLKLFRFAIPKAFFWFTVDPPHFWVRYEGPENGRGTPIVVMDLVAFQR